jgi:hypothetical protein
MLTTMLALAISMSFFYLMFSAICSAIQELIANAFRWRAKTLELSLGRLLQDPALVNRLYEHPVIKGLSSPRWLDKKSFHKPSYIPSGHFASALMDVLKISSTSTGLLSFEDPSSQPTEQTRRLLSGLMQGAGTEVVDLRKRLENWFDGSMERVGGWYKRTAHAWLWLIGIVVCGVLNADSVNVARLLWNDEAIRSSTVEVAKDYVKDNKQPPGSSESLKSLKEIRNQLSSVTIPLGWCTTKLSCWPPANVSEPENDFRVFPSDIAAWIAKIFGILVTVLALSQGAAFWFDLLQKFVNVRLAGASPDSTKRE